jgi:hypothetical protein
MDLDRQAVGHRYLLIEFHHGLTFIIFDLDLQP